MNNDNQLNSNPSSLNENRTGQQHVFRNMTIKCDRIVTSTGILNGAMTIVDGVIAEFVASPVEKWDLDLTGYIVYPGLIDTHNHGNCGFSLREPIETREKRTKEIQCYLENLSVFGITGVFPTCSIENISCVEEVSHQETAGAQILGIHVEGPWLKRAGEKGKAAAYPQPDHMTAEKMVEDGKGMLKLVALSPEIEQIEEIADTISKHNVKLALAHTSCTCKEAQASLERFGFQTVTHVGNAMSGIHHRDVGTLGAVLLNKNLHCEIVCDFVHLCPEMVQLILELKGFDHLMMVSDNSHYTGLPKGKYILPGGYIESDGMAKLTTDTGKIQGSNCFVHEGFKNLALKLNVPLEELWKITSYNACRHYGIPNRGKLEVGYAADFIVLNDQLDVLKTVTNGNLTYEKGAKQLIYNMDFIKNNRL